MGDYSPGEARQTAAELREKKQEMEGELDPQYEVAEMSREAIVEMTNSVASEDEGYLDELVDLAQDYDIVIDTEPIEEMKEEMEEFARSNPEKEESYAKDVELYEEVIETIEENVPTELDEDRPVIEVDLGTCGCQIATDSWDDGYVEFEAGNMILGFPCADSPNRDDNNVYLDQDKEEQEKRMERIKQQNLREERNQYKKLAEAAEEAEEAAEEIERAEERLEEAESLLDDEE